MEHQSLEVLVIPSEGSVCQKRPPPVWEEYQPIHKRLRRDSPDYPMEWEPYVPQDRTPVTSSLNCPKLQPQESTLKKKFPSSYNPYDFTSDALDPAYEWPRNSSSAKRDVAPLLQSILSLFPLGLRLKKLETLVWQEYRVKLRKVSLEQGYKDSLRFLEAVPGLKVRFPGKGTSRCLVQLDTAGGKRPADSARSVNRRS